MKKPLVSVIVPTYREAKNIPVLAKELDTHLKKAKMSYEIVVVDDNSNDGTEEAAARLIKKYPLRLIVRTKERGLSSAVVEGIRQAKGEVCVVMDADLSHPPVKVVELVKEITVKKADFTVGSRFVEGGSAPHFNAFRKLNAWGSKVLASPFTRVKDPMAGFFAFPRKLIKKVDSLNPLGFKIGLEIIVKCSPKNITEIPIEFQERLFGESKLSLKEQINYIRHLVRLFHFKYKSLSEFIRFGLVGSVGMVFDLTTVFLVHGVGGFGFRIARITGFVIALTVNFVLNRHFTFAHVPKRNLYRQYAEYFGISLVGGAVNWVLSVYLVEHNVFFTKFYLVAAFFGIVAGFVINFIGSKIFVFRSR